MSGANKEQLQRWSQEHRYFVNSGEFDKIPTTTLQPGDFVAIRQNNLIHLVYDVLDDKVIVGYDKDEEHVRLTLPLADVKEGGAFQTALLKFKGVQNRRVIVKGDTSYLVDTTREN